MGVAVLDGARQGNDIKDNPEKAIRHGYSKIRRSSLFTIGDSLLKNNKGTYRIIYDMVKQRQKDLHPGEEPGFYHRRAQRYMEKVLLKDLWEVWINIYGYKAELDHHAEIQQLVAKNIELSKKSKKTKAKDATKRKPTKKKAPSMMEELHASL